MDISKELKDLLDKQSGDMEQQLIEVYLQERSVEALVRVASSCLKGGVQSED